MPHGREIHLSSPSLSLSLPLSLLFSSLSAPNASVKVNVLLVHPRFITDGEPDDSDVAAVMTNGLWQLSIQAVQED